MPGCLGSKKLQLYVFLTPFEAIWNTYFPDLCRSFKPTVSLCFSVGPLLCLGMLREVSVSFRGVVTLPCHKNR